MVTVPMTGGLRTIAFACLVLGAPLVLLAAAWLPASCAAVSHYRAARVMPGTESYHVDMEKNFVFSMINVGVRAGALLAFAGYLFAAVKPGTLATLFTWVWSAVVASSHVVSFSIQHRPIRGNDVVPLSTLVLFWVIPATIALLSVIAAYGNVHLRRSRVTRD